MKIAIVHEMLVKLGGAERVLTELMKIFPEADIYTLMYDEAKVGSAFPKSKIRCSGPAQTQYLLTHKQRLSLPMMIQSVEKIDTRGYDLVISSSSGFAHGVITSGNTRHICYCHSPARYLYDANEEVMQELGVAQQNTNYELRITNCETIEPELKTNNFKLKTFSKDFFSSFKSAVGGPLVRNLFDRLRRWDEIACKRPNMYIANSAEVQRRIQTYYHRDSVILWPPVETSRFLVGPKPVSKREYYVVTSALTPFKRVDRVVRVMTKLNIPVKIIGDGKERLNLQSIAGKNIEFLGRISDEEVVNLYLEARGFLMPQKEDAGIAPVEAMAAGIPVFGYGLGGLLETNIDGVTGRFYTEDTDESFEAGMLAFHKEIQEGEYDNPMPIVTRAKEFDGERFREAIRGYAREQVKTS